MYVQADNSISFFREYLNGCLYSPIRDIDIFWIGMKFATSFAKASINK